MVPSELLQNVPFGRYKHFLLKITILPNTIKIESRVPQAMDNPMPPTFGRIDALRGSSVQITKITDSTKHHENRCVGAPGHGHTKYTHVWSLRRTGVDFRSILCRFCMKFYVRFEEMEASSQCFILPVNPSNHQIKKETPPANQRIARSLPTRPIGFIIEKNS